MDISARVISGVIGGVLGGVGVLLIILFRKPVYCPNCKAKMPMFRKPDSLDQSLWGGWTCQRCGFKIDRDGNAVQIIKPLPTEYK
jgi:hypothetical protein